MTTFRVGWAENIMHFANVEAESEEKIREMFENGEIKPIKKQDRTQEIENSFEIISKGD